MLSTQRTGTLSAPNTPPRGSRWASTHLAKGAFPYLLIALLCVLVLLHFSDSTSPCWSIMRAFDPAIFEIIGKYWAEGFLPYVDLWDSKGPIIFFSNLLGYWLTSNRYGIFIIQLLCLVSTAWLSYAFLRQRCTPWRSLLYVVALLLAYATISKHGNQVGEYTMPMAAWATFCTYKWSERYADSGLADHPWGYAVVYGLSFSGSLLSRLSNAVGLCAAILVVFVVLVAHRRWASLARNVGGFLLGFALLFVPFAAYFAAHGAFGEMWYAMFSYNLEYAMVSNPSESIGNWAGLAYRLIFFLCVIALLASALVAVIQGSSDRRMGLLWLPVPLLTLLWLFNSYADSQYAISNLPFLCVAMALFERLTARGRLARWVQTALLLAIFGGFINYIRVLPKWCNGPQSDYDKIMEGLTEADKQSFVAYMSEPYVYLVYDIKPCYRYFVCQDWAVQNGESLRNRVRQTYQTGRAKWVLGWKDLSDCVIKDILDSLYVPAREDSEVGFVLYKRKE